MRGSIFINVVNKETGSVEDVIEQKNILVNQYMSANIINGNGFNHSLVISTASYKPSMHSIYLHEDKDNLTNIDVSSPIFQVPSVLNIDETESTPFMRQFSGRFNPPASGTTRTIKSVLLHNSRLLRAFTELNTPCLQTDSQYLDIYYRIIFDYKETSGNMSYPLYKATMFNSKSSYYCQNNIIHSFPFIKNKSNTNYVFCSNYYSANEERGIVDTLNITNSSYYVLFNANGTSRFNFNLNNGIIIKGFSFLNNFNTYLNNQNTVETNVFDERSKIQNLFGYQVDSLNINSLHFLDIDNLANGSGELTLTGDWENVEPHVDDNLYFKTEFPKRVTIEITKSGSTGEAEYKYHVKHYIRTLDKSGKEYSGDDNYQVSLNINGLFSVTSINSTATLKHLNRKGLLEDVSPNVFTVEQISAIIAYDETSILIPLKNKVILYSLPSSNYWIINGDFTNIHQLAISNNIVYIACRNTGLYSVNPRISLNAIRMNVTGYRTPNFNNCNGVAVGYNNKIWAVSEDCLACYDNGNWTIYDSTTTHPFTPSEYSHIAYFKVDTYSDKDEMFFIYRRNVNSRVGFWWSTNKAVLDCENMRTTNGRNVKTNKGFLVGVKGKWNYNSDVFLNFYETNSAPNDKTVGKDFYNFSSDTLVEDINKNHYIFSLNATSNNGSVLYHLNGDKYMNAGYTNGALNRTNNYSETVITDEDSVASYKRQVILDNGIIFKCCTSNYNGNYVFRGEVILIGHDQSPHGGDSRWVCTKFYGWNGSSWEENHTGSKIIHTDQQDLYKGVKIGFTDGSSGISFRKDNVYKFGLCEGILKDNATRLSFNIPVFFTRSEQGITPLEVPKVPALKQFPTGVVRIDDRYKSKDVYVNENDEVVFPGNNLGQFAVGDIELSNNFEIEISSINRMLDSHRLTGIGFGSIKRSFLPFISICNHNGSWQIFQSNSLDDVFDYQHINSSGGLNSETRMRVKRKNNVFELYINDVLTYSHTTPYIKLGHQRLQLIFYIRKEDGKFLPANKTCDKVTVISNGSDNGVKLGNPNTLSEAFDINQKGLVPENPITGKLNGITVPVKIDGSFPSPNEISLDPISMIATFHPSDEGKDIEISCTRVWNK